MKQSRAACVFPPHEFGVPRAANDGEEGQSSLRHAIEQVGRVRALRGELGEVHHTTDIIDLCFAHREGLVAGLSALLGSEFADYERDADLHGGKEAARLLGEQQRGARAGADPPSSTVDILTVPYPDHEHEHERLFVVDDIDEAIVSDAQPIGVALLAAVLLDTTRSGILRERLRSSFCARRSIWIV